MEPLGAMVPWCHIGAIRILTRGSGIIGAESRCVRVVSRLGENHRIFWQASNMPAGISNREFIAVSTFHDEEFIVASRPIEGCETLLRQCLPPSVKRAKRLVLGDAYRYGLR